MALGRILREAREKRQLTLSQVAASTRMKTQVAQALEAEDYKKIPAPIYGRGFIKMYAEFLGVDPKPLIAEYNAALAGPVEPPPAPASAQTPGKPPKPAFSRTATPSARFGSAKSTTPVQPPVPSQIEPQETEDVPAPSQPETPAVVVPEPPLPAPVEVSVEPSPSTPEPAAPPEPPSIVTESVARPIPEPESEPEPPPAMESETEPAKEEPAAQDPSQSEPRLFDLASLETPPPAHVSASEPAIRPDDDLFAWGQTSSPQDRTEERRDFAPVPPPAERETVAAALDLPNAQPEGTPAAPESAEEPVSDEPTAGTGAGPAGGEAAGQTVEENVVGDLFVPTGPSPFARPPKSTLGASTSPYARRLSQHPGSGEQPTLSSERAALKWKTTAVLVGVLIVFLLFISSLSRCSGPQKEIERGHEKQHLKMAVEPPAPYVD